MKILFGTINRLFLLVVSLLLTILHSSQIYARAGGAGGGGSSGGDDDGLFGFVSDIIDLFFLNPLLGGIAVIAVLIMYYFTRRNRAK